MTVPPHEPRPEPPHEPPHESPQGPPPTWDQGAYAPQAYWPAQPLAYADPNDPLVVPPGAGFDGWLSRVTNTTMRSWRGVLAVLALTQVLPIVVVFGVAAAVFGTGSNMMVGNPGASPSGAQVGAIIGSALGAILLIVPFQMLGYAASTWIVVREATGERVGVGEALRRGLRRTPGLTGWAVAAGLLAVVGLCLCFLPGIYLAFVFSLVGPVYLFERANPIGRSWRLFHDNFGVVLGRVALVAVFTVLLQSVGSVVQQLAPTGTDPTAGDVVLLVVVLALATLVTLPATLVQVVGLIVTYAEQRARQAPLTGATLAQELAS